jgi:preprotein translocase subunit YajC
MRMTTLLLTGVALATATVATAQAPASAQVTAGATVYDTSGGTLGTIASVEGSDAIIDTGANKLAIPLASFGAGTNGPVLAATKAQLDGAAVEAATAARAALMAKLVPGAEIRGQAGQTVIGSVKSVSGDLVLITTPEGEVNVPSTSLKAGPSGLLLQMSADEFNKAVAATKG